MKKIFALLFVSLIVIAPILGCMVPINSNVNTALNTSIDSTKISNNQNVPWITHWNNEIFSDSLVSYSAGKLKTHNVQKVCGYEGFQFQNGFFILERNDRYAGILLMDREEKYSYYWFVPEEGCYDGYSIYLVEINANSKFSIPGCIAYDNHRLMVCEDYGGRARCCVNIELKSGSEELYYNSLQDEWHISERIYHVMDKNREAMCLLYFEDGAYRLIKINP